MQQRSQAQRGPRTTRNDDLNQMLTTIRQVIQILASMNQPDLDIEKLLKLEQFITYDIIYPQKDRKNKSQTEEALKQLMSDKAIEQGSMSAVYYEGYLLIVICYQ